MVIRLVLVVGLPGSGKTFLYHYYRARGYQLHDDFLDAFWQGNLLQALRDGESVYVTDPRLCLPAIWQRYFPLLTKSLTAHEYRVICFVNDPQACLINVEQREQNLVRRSQISADVWRLSKYYAPEQYPGIVRLVKTK